MTVPLVSPLSSQLRSALENEFGEHGSEVLNFLDAAFAHVAAPTTVLLGGNQFAYCLRESLGRLLDASGLVLENRLSSTSRSVVVAFRAYESNLSLQEDTEVSLSPLRARIDELAQIHESESAAAQKLAWILFDRMGVELSVVGEQKFSALLNLWREINTGVHRTYSIEQARLAWSNVIEILSSLFADPVGRSAAIDRLAHVDDPGEQEVLTFQRLIDSRAHERRFYSRVRSPSWLILLPAAGLLTAPKPGVWWGGFELVRTLREEHAGHAVEFLVKLWSVSEVTDAAVATTFAMAAHEMGEEAAELITKIASKFPVDTSMWTLEWASQLPPSNPAVIAIADILLNKSVLEQQHHWQPFVDAYVSGTTSENFERRIRLLDQKAWQFDPKESMSWLLYSSGTSVADISEHDRHDGGGLLLDLLVRTVAAAREHASDEYLLECLTATPSAWRDRVVSWVLSLSSSAPLSDYLDQIRSVMATRGPTVDDVAMCQTMTDRFTSADFDTLLQQHLGDPPAAGAISEAFNRRDGSQSWWNVHYWSTVLPPGAFTRWTVALEEMAQHLSPPIVGARDHDVEFRPATSPISVAEMNLGHVSDACERIRDWRAGPNDWPNSAREVGLALTSAASTEPARWSSDPMDLFSLLEHPTYIDALISAFASQVVPLSFRSDVAIDIATYVSARDSKSVQPIGDEPMFDYEADWSSSIDGSLKILQRFANNTSDNDDFRGNRAEAWRLVLVVAEKTVSTDRRPDESEDSLHRAINRSSTKAFEVALALMGLDFRTDGEISPTGLHMLDLALSLPGEDGKEYRAVVATHLPFLNTVAREWLTSNLELLFGSESGALGRDAIDMALKWGTAFQPLLDGFADQVFAAVARKTERALDHLLIAMLHEGNGYDVRKVIGFLSNTSAAASTGGELARLIRSDDIEQQMLQIALAAWTEALACFDKDSIQGFGDFAACGRLPDNDWLLLVVRTLRKTGGRLESASETADRLSKMHPSRETLSALDLLVRCRDKDWRYRGVLEFALHHLEIASDLSESVEYRRLHVAIREREG